MRGVGAGLDLTCPRWPFRGRACDSQSTSASMRSGPRRSNLTPSQLPETNEEQADRSLRTSDHASESLMSVMLFPGSYSHWQPHVSFTYLFSWKTKASERIMVVQRRRRGLKLEQDLKESLKNSGGTTLCPDVPYSNFLTLLHGFHSVGMKNADTATHSLFYKTTHLLCLSLGSPIQLLSN